MGGISRRAYAKRRGCTEKAIRDRIADGTLVKAVLPDGTLDADKADKLLAAKVTAGKHVGSDLNDARRRKLAAGVALLQDEVEALVVSVVPVDGAGYTFAKSPLRSRSAFSDRRRLRRHGRGPGGGSGSRYPGPRGAGGACRSKRRR
ncbi:hypothetical protein AJ88_27650 [Mesorhizobium amorphae CCBAU 01583]|nr:hypothetical protein AJ88_27650 [Mesorhizobium amorphae CCBAU 01583]